MKNRTVIGVIGLVGLAAVFTKNALHETTAEEAALRCGEYASANRDKIQAYIDSSSDGLHSLRSNNPLPFVENIACTYDNDNEGNIVVVDSQVLVNE